MEFILANALQPLTEVVTTLTVGQFIVVDCLIGLPEPGLPYSQAARTPGGWYCEVVSGAFLPADVWPINELALRRMGWNAPYPVHPDDNWSSELPLDSDVASHLLGGLRYGRCCPESAFVRWSVGTFPSGPDGGLPLPVDLPHHLDLAA